jgi:hypothetical protein
VGGLGWKRSALAKSDSRAAAIPGNKLYAGHFEGALYRFDRALLESLAPFKPRHGIDRNLGGSSKFANAPTKGRPCHLALNRQKNHNTVPISVAFLDLIAYRDTVTNSVQ